MYVYIHYHSKVCTLYEYFKTFLKVVSYAHYGCIYLISKKVFYFALRYQLFLWLHRSSVTWLFRNHSKIMI